MFRNALEQLKNWSQSPNRKPLIIRGSRQVGKTWLATQCGSESFDSTAHVVFLNNQPMQQVFSGSLEPDRLLRAIGAATSTNPFNGKTLVFLDEIQECPRAIAALKPLYEKYPDIPIIAAGSLLGVALNKRILATDSPITWPVGKVDYLDLFPLSFTEFLRALDKDSLAQLILAGDFDLLSSFSEQLLDFYRLYLFCGGMPAAVQIYAQSKDLAQVRTVQQNLLRDYEFDFAKHVDSPSETERIRDVWKAIPAQIARETPTTRFIYSKVKPGGRGRDYKDAVSWLADAGLAIKSQRVTNPQIPLRSYVSDTYFKLFLLDVGILGASLGLTAQNILLNQNFAAQTKGALAEQFICQQLVSSGFTPYYWSSDNNSQKAEVDFLIQSQGSVLPIEVKAEKNVRSQSLAKFAQAHQPNRCIRFSQLEYKQQDWLVNLPLYAAEALSNHDVE